MRARLAVLLLVVALGLGLPWMAGLALAADDPPSATPAQLAALQEILARPEFQAAAGRSLLDRLLDPIRVWVRWLSSQIREWLRGLLGPAADAGGSVLVLGSVVVGMLIVLGAGVVLYRLSRGAVAEDATLESVSTIRPPRAADELARARAAARAGQPRRAIHHHYRAVLLGLDERDQLALDQALTNRELVPRLIGAPALAAPFAELVARFDRLWYGQPDCSSAEYAEFARLADRLWQGADAA